MLGGDEKTELSYIIVATTAVMLARCDFLQYNRLRSVSTSTLGCTYCGKAYTGSSVDISADKTITGQSKSIWCQSGGPNLTIWHGAQSDPIWLPENKPNLINLQKAFKRKKHMSTAIWH